MDKEYLGWQRRLNLRIGLANQKLCAEESRIDVVYDSLQKIHVALVGGDNTFPVPLIHIERV